MGWDGLLPCTGYLWSHGSAGLQSSSRHGLRLCDGRHRCGDDRIVLPSYLLSRLLSSRIIPVTLARGLTTTITAAHMARRRAEATPMMQPKPQRLTRAGEVITPTPAK